MAKQLVYQSRFTQSETVGFISECRIVLPGTDLPGVILHKDSKTIVMLAADFHARYVAVDTDADRD